MSESIALGVNGISVPPNSHICGFFQGTAERDQIMSSFVLEGLRGGEKCACIVDRSEVDSVRAALSTELDVPDDVVLSYHDAYLRRGAFSATDMISFLDEVGMDSLAGGCSVIRATADMAWANSENTEAKELLHYEAELNRFVPRNPQLLLCLYDLDHFGGQILVDILKTHPKVLMGSIVLENLFYLEPDEFLAARA